MKNFKLLSALLVLSSAAPALAQDKDGSLDMIGWTCRAAKAASNKFNNTYKSLTNPEANDVRFIDPSLQKVIYLRPNQFDFDSNTECVRLSHTTYYKIMSIIIKQPVPSILYNFSLINGVLFVIYRG